MRIYSDHTASDTDITQVGRMRIDRLGGAEVYTLYIQKLRTNRLGLALLMRENKSPVIGNSPWIGSGRGRN